MFPCPQCVLDSDRVGCILKRINSDRRSHKRKIWCKEQRIEWYECFCVCVSASVPGDFSCCPRTRSPNHVPSVSHADTQAHGANVYKHGRHPTHCYEVAARLQHLQSSDRFTTTFLAFVHNRNGHLKPSHREDVRIVLGTHGCDACELGQNSDHSEVAMGMMSDTGQARFFSSSSSSSSYSYSSSEANE